MKGVLFKAQSTNWENATLKSVMSSLCAQQEGKITPYENVRYKFIVVA